ncbi:IPT/TIG domain-containing protein [Sinomonas albida]|uniref:IPT/TIG domain-containing protein n=1 Tax=Sinomonas albida TaxID=369942 RepID=UPI001457B001|nr:IPT/TIG domain-containing protein [Sinomonas albida]
MIATAAIVLSGSSVAAFASPADSSSNARFAGGIGANLGIELAIGQVGANVQSATPLVSALSPGRGSEAGGTIVTVSGSNLIGATAVTVDGRAYSPATGPAPSAGQFAANADGTLTFVTLAHPAATVGVTVTTPQGTSAPASFSFLPVQAQVAYGGIWLAPSAGPVAGGQAVTITGDQYLNGVGVSKVVFGGKVYTPTYGSLDGSHFVLGDGTLTLVTAPHAAGSVDVVVSTFDGRSAAAAYTYVAAPANLALAPDAGSVAGGQPVTVSGTGLGSATSLDWGGTALAPGATADASHFAVNGNGTLTVSTPAHAAGPISVTVTNPGGTSAPAAYTYAGAPAITGINPGTGPVDGGNPVVITGSALTGATEVSVDGAPVAFTVTNDRTISLTMPAHAAGRAVVVVTGPGGTSAPVGYAYQEAPSGNASAAPAGPTALAATGEDFPLGIALTGLGLLLAGAGLVLFARQRQNR